MEVIELPRMAAALSCQPRTLCRLIHGPFAARSLARAPVSLGVAARALQADQKALCKFLIATLDGKDDALIPDIAIMVSELTRPTFYRYFKEGKIPAVVHVGRFSRFSRETIKSLMPF